MTRFRVEVVEPTSLLAPDDDPAEAFERVWALLPAGRPRRLWGFLERDGGLFVKGLRSLRGPGPRGFCQGLRTRRERRNLREMAARGLPVPAVLAFGQESRAGFPVRSFLVERRLPGARDLDAWLAEHGPGAPARRAVFARLGALVRRLHSVGVFHRDLACRNILVCDDHELHLIDCPRARIDPPALRRAGLRRADLFRVVKGLLRAGATDAELHVFGDYARLLLRERQVLGLARAALARPTRKRSLALQRWLLTGR